MFTTKTHKTAFSLLELLVVMTIIAIITAASLPSFLKFTQTARLRAGARDICTALRSARRYAITKRTTYATAVYLNDNACTKNAVSLYETATNVELQRMAGTIYLMDHDGSDTDWLVFAFDPRGSRGTCPSGWSGNWDTIRVVDPDNRYIDITVNPTTGGVTIADIAE